MTTLYTAPIGSGRRRLAEPRYEESVRQPSPPPHVADPPIYKALISQWASHGRTLPGRVDHEWNRLTAAPVWADRTVRVSGFSGTLVRQGGGR
ncbi:hypothetical protein [Streptomyces sp. NPDC054975]